MAELIPGKIPENVLKRSILKPISKARSEVLEGPAAGSDAAILDLDGLTLVSSASATLGLRHAVYSAANNIAVRGGEAVGIQVLALFPEGTEEPELKETESRLDGYCRELGIEITGGSTEISKAVKEPVIQVTAIGKASEERVKALTGAEAGDTVILAGYIALEGTALMAEAGEAELLAKFPDDMVRRAQNFGKSLSVKRAADIAISAGAKALHDLSTGGVFAGLWELAEASDVGLEVDLRKLPVRQESIEICNLFDINPYGLISGGGLLIATKDPEPLLLELGKAGINAAVVGVCTDSNDRVLINGDTRRFLEIPKYDEINKIIS